MCKILISKSSEKLLTHSGNFLATIFNDIWTQMIKCIKRKRLELCLQSEEHNRKEQGGKSCSSPSLLEKSTLVILVLPP